MSRDSSIAARVVQIARAIQRSTGAGNASTDWTGLQLGAFRAVPVRKEDRLVGLLLVEGGGPQSDSDSAAIELAGCLLALESVDRARQRAHRELLQEALSLRDELTHRRARSMRLKHDLRTPLVAMKGYVDMLLRGMAGPLNARAVKYLQRLSRAVEHQRDLIEAELGEGGRDAARPINVNRLLERAVAKVSPGAFARGISLRMESAPQHAWVLGNRDQLQMLCDRLLRIALRQAHSPSGIVATLSAWDAWIRLEVRSLSPWQPQVDEFHVCHEIVRRHGGQLFVNEGTQAVIEVQLPRDKAAERWLQLSGAPHPLIHGEAERS